MEEELERLLRAHTLQIVVRAGARKDKITSVRQGAVHLDIAAPAKDGRANERVERFLTARLQRQAVIVSGRTSRKKLVRLGTAL